MPSVDPVFAQWLQSPALWAVLSDAAQVAKWGELGITAERLSPLALKTDATAEATRQRDFLAGPLAIDVHLLEGAWRDKIGQIITITIDRLGYDAGVDVFLIGAEDDLARDLSSVTVIRRL